MTTTKAHTPETWIAASGSGGQAIVYCEKNGRAVAVIYDAADAPIIAARAAIARATGEA